MNLSFVKLALAVSIVTLISLNAVGQTPEAQPSGDRAPRESGAITGKVVNESGQPLAGAFIQVRAVNAARTDQVAVSDNKGHFRVDGLAQVPYFVAAGLPSYTPQRPLTNSPAPQYKVGDSVTLVLIKGGVITGTVTNANGDPVVGIGVAVLPVRTMNAQRQVGGAVAEVPTDDRGVYRIYGLPTATYLVVATGINDHSQTGVNSFSSDVPTYAPSATRDTAAEISVRAGEEVGNIDIRYRGERGRTISGTVAEMRGEEGNFGAILTSIGSDGQRWHARPLEGGSRAFAFEALADGDYYLTGISYLKDNERALSESKLISVRGSDISGLELTTHKLGSIAGRLLLEETKAAECTEKTPLKLTDTTVGAWHRVTEANKNKPQIIWTFGTPARADAQGNFRMRNLVPDEYYFQPRFTDKGWYLHSITLGPPQRGAKPLDASRVWTTLKQGDQLSGLTVTLAQGAASFTGKLPLAEGESPPERMFLYLVPAEAERADEPLRFYGGPLNDKAQVMLNNLAPGRYWVLTGQIVVDAGLSQMAKARLPDGTRTRAALRRQGEAGKTQIELKPCQQMVDFEIRRSAQE